MSALPPFLSGPSGVELLQESVELPEGFTYATFAIFGLLVGSFLNAAIYRLPLEGMSLWTPRRSLCPRCKRSLTWSENVPVLSWVLQGGKCRGCRAPISIRYPLVELGNAGLWMLAYAYAPSLPLAIVYAVVLSGLVVATFVDFDHMEIPDEVSIGGMIAAPLISFLLPELHRDTYLAGLLSKAPEGGVGPAVDGGGAFLASLAGVAVGGGVLLAIGWLGRALYKRDAMGLGDVKLLAAGGGFIGPGGALVALFLASLVASVVGAANIARFLCLVSRRARRRGGQKSFRKALHTARVVGRYLPFGPYLALGTGIVLLDWKDVVGLLKGLAF